MRNYVSSGNLRLCDFQFLKKEQPVDECLDIDFIRHRGDDLF